MPLYEYECEEHGAFELLRSLSEFNLGAACPKCGEAGARIVSAPNLAVMARSEVVARDRNEKSRHEPRLSSTPDGHVHTSSCNHGKTKTRQQARARATDKPPERPKLQRYAGKRPWVMEHG